MDSSYFLVSNSSPCLMGSHQSCTDLAASPPAAFSDFEHITSSLSPLSFGGSLAANMMSGISQFDQFDSFIPYLENHQNNHHNLQSANNISHLNHHNYHHQLSPTPTRSSNNSSSDSVGSSPPATTSTTTNSTATTTYSSDHSTTSTPLHSASLVNVCAGVDDDDDPTGTLASFVVDPCDPLGTSNVCGHNSDAGYTSGVDLFSSSSIVGDPSDSTDDAYCFRQFTLDTSTGNHHSGHSHSFLSSSHHPHLDESHHLLDDKHEQHHLMSQTELNTSITSAVLGTSSSYCDILSGAHYFGASGGVSSGGGCGSSSSSSGYSDNYDCISDRNNSLGNDPFFNNNNSYDGVNSMSNDNNMNFFNNNTTTTANGNRQQQKRSVLMNLLIDGSDVGAGYTSINCRPLASTQHRSSQYNNSSI